MDAAPLSNAAAAAAAAGAEAARRAAEEAAARAAAEAAAQAAAGAAAAQAKAAAESAKEVVQPMELVKTIEWDPFDAGGDGEDLDFTAMAEGLPSTSTAAATNPEADPGYRAPASGSTPLPPSSAEPYQQTGAIKNASQHLSDREGAYKEKERELSVLLGEAGPALGPEESKKLQEEFWKRGGNAKIASDFEIAQADFDRVLEANVKAYADIYAKALIDGNEAIIQNTKTQLDYYMQQAGPAAGRIGMRISATMMATPGIDEVPDVENTLMAELITPYLGEAIAERQASGETLGNVYGDLKSELSGIFNAQKLGPGTVSNVMSVLGELQVAEDLSPIEKALHISNVAKAYPSGNPVRSLAMVGIFAGALSIGDAVAQGDYWGAAKEAIGTAKDAGDLLNTFEKFQKFTGISVEAAGRLSAAFGGAASMIAGIQATGKFVGGNQEDLRYLGLAAANFVNAGALFAIGLGVTGPIAVGIVAVTALLATGLELWINKDERAALRQQTADLLLKTLQPPAYAQAIVDADPAQLRALADAGVTPAGLKRLFEAGFGPSLFKAGKDGGDTDLTRLLAEFGQKTKGQKLDVVGMLIDTRNGNDGVTDTTTKGYQDLRLAIEAAVIDVKEPQTTLWWQQRFEAMAMKQEPFAAPGLPDPDFDRYSRGAIRILPYMPLQPVIAT